MRKISLALSNLSNKKVKKPFFSPIVPICSHRRKSNGLLLRHNN